MQKLLLVLVLLTAGVEFINYQTVSQVMKNSDLLSAANRQVQDDLTGYKQRLSYVESNNVSINDFAVLDQNVQSRMDQLEKKIRRGMSGVK